MKMTILISLVCSSFALASPSTTKTNFKQLVCDRNETPVDGDDNSITLSLEEDGTYSLNWKQVLGGDRPTPVVQPKPVVVKGLVCESEQSDARLVRCQSQTNSFQLTTVADPYRGEQLRAELNGQYISEFSANASGSSFPDYCRAN